MENPEELIQQVKDLISSNRTAKALELLAKNQLSSLDKELIILNSRFNKIQEDQTFGIINENEARQEINKINLALLGLSEKIGKPEKINSTKNVANSPTSNRKYGLIGGGILLIIIVVFAIFQLIPKDNDRAPSISHQINGNNLNVSVNDANPPYTLVLSKDNIEKYSKALGKAGEYIINISTYLGDPGEYKIIVTDSRGFDNIETFTINQTQDLSVDSKPVTNSETKVETTSEPNEEPNIIDPQLTPAEVIANVWTNMIDIPSGTFTMGCTSEQSDCENDEKPIHQVTLTSFKINKYEVTQEEWFVVMGNYPSQFSVCEKCPVEQVSYNDVKDFINKLNSLTEKNYRLPTEAEWEYAARGGENLKYSGSQDLDDVGWFSKNENNKTNPVGRKSANGYGLFDMSGNVWEWCHGWHGTYPTNSQSDPNSYGEGPTRILRGGSWGNDAKHARVSNRSPIGKDHVNGDLGFRLTHN